MKNLIFLNSHPIQYFAPLYKELSQNNKLKLEVWYCSNHGMKGEIDKQFNTNVKWDISLLEGYKYDFLSNQSLNPSIYSFWGLMNFSLIFKIIKIPKSIIVVHGWNFFSCWLAIFFGKLLGHQIAMRAETPLKQELLKPLWKLKLRKIILGNLLFRILDYGLYLGVENKLFYKHYGLPNNKLKFMPYAVDNQRFKKSARELAAKKELLLEKYELPENKLIFLFSGKFIPKKRPLDLLNAFAGSCNNNAFLVLMGEGVLRKEMEILIKKHKLNNVLLTGFINQSEVVNYYALADVFVMCSTIGETWGLSTNEAMNFGLPLILSDMTGCSNDLVKEEENGFVFPVGDITYLTDLLSKFINMSHEVRVSKGKKSLQLVEQYSYSRAYECIKTIVN